MKKGTRKVSYSNTQMLNGANSDPLTNVKSVARRTGFSEGHIRRLLRDGSVKGIKLRKIWLTKASDFKKYQG